MPAKKYTLFFNPHSNMTAFELATILLTLPIFGKQSLSQIGISATENEWKKVPPPLRKYFVKDSPFAEKEPRGMWEESPQEEVEEPAPAPQVQQQPPQTWGPGDGPQRELTAGELLRFENKPAKQPERPIGSAYHRPTQVRDEHGKLVVKGAVESLLPDGMSVAPAPDGA